MTRVIGLLAAAAGLALGAVDDPLKTLRKEHPRLILLDSELDRMRSLIQQNPQARRIHTELLKEADRLVATPPVEYKLAGTRLAPQTRRCLERIYTLALLYRLDGRTPYLDRALNEMRAVAGFKDWNPAYFLDTAEITHAFAIGYDWLYPALNPEDRAWIRAAIAEKGLAPGLVAYESPAWWVTSRFYWNLVANGGMAIGALAVADEEPEKSRAVLRYALEFISRALTSYAPDGSWAEGPGYWHAATSYTACFFSALETALGSDFGLAVSRGLDKTGRFRIYSTSPSGRTFNYGDAHEHTEPAPEMFWLGHLFGEPCYAWFEQRLLEGGIAPDALDLVWFQPEARSPKQENWPLDAVFHGAQVAFLRSAWDDPQAIFLAVKGGDNKSNHGHLDLGTFVLDAGGVRWALDLGPDEPGVAASAGRQRWGYFRMRTESHNTVMIDDENQDPRAEAAITNHLFSPDLAWVEVDLSRTSHHRLKQFQRKIGITQGQQVFIEDVLQSEQPLEALWGMLTDAEIKLDGQTAELSRNGWNLSAEILSPRHAVFDIAPITTPSVAGSAVRKLVVRLGEKVTDMDLKVTLTPYRSGQAKPKITPRFGS